MREGSCHLERSGEHFIKKEEHFERVSEVKKEIVLLLLVGSLQFRLKNGNELTSLSVGESVSKAGYEQNHELELFMTSVESEEESPIQEHNTSRGRRRSEMDECLEEVNYKHELVEDDCSSEEFQSRRVALVDD